MKLADAKTLQDVLDHSFRIPYFTPIKMFWPQYSREYELELNNAFALIRCYYVQNNVIIVRSSEAAYVMPFEERVEDILLQRGFFIKSMYVPFAKGDYPIERTAEFDRVFKGYI
ncbi:MAG: hypothetical protein IKG14_02960 [Clostridia bacterium]|nr:hypothetical protein [Clostridia bacterium]